MVYCDEGERREDRVSKTIGRQEKIQRRQKMGIEGNHYRNPRLFGNRDRRDDQQSDCAVHTQKNSFISNLVLQRVTFVGGGKLNWNFGGALCLRRHKGNHKYVTGDLRLCQRK